MTEREEALARIAKALLEVLSIVDDAGDEMRQLIHTVAKTPEEDTDDQE